MRKLNLVAGLILMCAASASAQVAVVSGNLRDLGVNNATQNTTYVQFQLQNFVGIPRVIGTNSIVSKISPPFKPDASGNISGNIQRNDFITPANTFYRVCVYFQGTVFQCNNFLIVTSTFNLNSATPLNGSLLPLPPQMIGPLANLPLLCSVGQVYFATDGIPGSNLQYCVQTNVWAPDQLVGLASAIPATCTVGEDYFASDATPGRNKYYCTAPNVWTQQLIGAGSPGGGAASVQYNNSGAFAGATGITTDGTSFRIKGYDPFADVTAYGVRSATGGVPQGNWAQCATSTTVALTTTNGGFTFANGDGIEIDGCGPTPTISTPSAPTVTPMTMASPTRTQYAVAIPGASVGASTYNYEVVGRDRFGGMTVASSAGTTTTGQSTLGLQTATISSLTLSNNTITVVTTGNTDIGAGTMIHLYSLTIGNAFNGFYSVFSVTNATTFVLSNVPVDSRAQGWTAFDTTTQSSGTIAWYNTNHIHITPVAGTWEYYIYCNRPGDGTTYTICGATLPNGSTGYIDSDWDDLGATFLASQTFPRYVPATPPPSSVTNQMYSGTVTAGGGTTSLTVTPATSQTVGPNQFITMDAEPGILAALKATSFGTAPNNIPACAFIPGSSPFSGTGLGNGRRYYMYYPLIVPTGSCMRQENFLETYETITFSGGDRWDGMDVSSGAPAMGWGNYIPLGEDTGEPTMWITGAGNEISHLFFYGGALTNGGIHAIFDRAYGSSMDHVNLSGPTGSGDYLSMNVVWRDTTDTISPLTLKYVAFNGGPDQVVDKSWTPLLWIEPGQNGSGTCTGEGLWLTLDHINYNRRGFAATNNNCSNGPGNIEQDWTYRQGGLVPVWTLQNTSGAGNHISIKNVNQDTEGNPVVANLNTGPGPALTIDVASNSVNNPLVSGTYPVIGHYIQAGDLPYKVPNRNGSWEAIVNGVFAPYDTTGTYVTNGNNTAQAFFEPIIIPGGQSILFSMSAPTSLTATAAGGGSVPAGTYQYCVTAVGFDLGESVCSVPSSTVTTVGGGNQTVNLAFTGVVGAQSYNAYRCLSLCTTNGLASGGNWKRSILHIASNAPSDTSATSTGELLPQVSGTGNVLSNNTGFYAPNLFIASPLNSSGVSVADTLATAATAARTHTFPDASGNVVIDSATQTISSKTYTGASIAVTGITDGLISSVVTTGTTATLCTNLMQNTFNEEATAGQAVGYTLCTAAAGKRQCVFNANNGTNPDTGILTVNTSAGGQFIIFTDGTLSTSGGNVTSGGAAVDSACFLGVDSTHWQMIVGSGVWTKH